MKQHKLVVKLRKTVIDLRRAEIDCAMRSEYEMPGEAAYWDKIRVERNALFSKFCKLCNEINTKLINGDLIDATLRDVGVNL